MLDTREPVRVLLIFGRMERGGAEVSTLELMRHVDRTRYRLDFCALSGLRGALDEEIRCMGGEVHYCKLGRSFPARFIKLLRRHRYHVVHSNVHMVSGFILLLASLAGVPGRIAHFRSTQAVRHSSRSRVVRDAVLMQLINRLATHILSVSRAAMTSSWGPNWSNDPRCQVVYSGRRFDPSVGPLDAQATRRQLNVPHDAKLCIHVGRFDEPKNHLRLVSIFAEMARRDPNVHLLLVGDGVLKPQVERSVLEHGLQGRVTFAGLRTDVPALLGASDLMVFPSLWEGLPGAVLEAAAAGVPVLASNLPVINEVQEHFSSVYAMDLARSDEAWAEQGLVLLYATPSPNTNRSLAGWNSTPFSVERAAKSMSGIWEEAAHAR